MHRLASIFLQEEKGRIHRLRKIKSVLASGTLMGTTSSSSTQHDRRRRRRPYPTSSQQDGHLHHANHRRFYQANDASLQAVQPKYPTNPFGNVDKYTLQLPVPMGRKRTSLEEAVRSGRKEGKHPQSAFHTNSSPGRSGTVWDDDTRAIQEVVSVLAGGKHGSYGSRSDLRNISEAPSSTVHEDNRMNSTYRGHNSSDTDGNRGQLRHNPESLHRSRDGVKGSQEISSGPSAIDLFDQCGLVPVAAIEKEGLVGTTDTTQSSQRHPANSTSTGWRDSVPSVADSNLARYPVATAVVAPRPPLVPGGPSPAPNDSRGARNHPRDAGRYEERAARTKRGQPAATHGVKPRPPFTGGSVSKSSRTKQAQQRAPSSSGKDAEAGPAKSTRSMGRGVPSDAAAAESSSRSSRIEGSSNTDSPSAPTTEGRTRRRWNVGEGTPPAATASPLPKAPPCSESSSVPTPVSASLSASEQRIASAKERLHKDKGLNALKSEHVEALSILQDISCPSTAAGAGGAERSSETATEGNEGGQETTPDPNAVEDARIGLLRERKNSSANAAAGPSAVAARGGAVGQQGLPVDDKFDELSADLPRIGSKEQAALRTMYRKWWMKVASGGSPPSPCPPVGLLKEGSPPVAEQHLTLQGGVTGGDKTGTAESLATTGAADILETDRLSDSNVAEPRQNGDQLSLQEESASTTTAVEPPTDEGVAAVMAAVEKDNGLSDPTCATGELSCRAEEDVESSTGKKASESPAQDGNITHITPLQAEVDVPTHLEEKRGAGEAAVARDTLLSEQQQKQGISSDVESVSEDDGLEKEQEEGHHGRIYLPDGRFVSTWRNSSEEMADAVATLQNAEKVGGGGDCGEVLDASETKPLAADDESLGYADEDFEFED